MEEFELLVPDVPKYIHGVGDPVGPLDKTFGGVFQRERSSILCVVKCSCREKHEPGDEIVLVGFSRGAYTAWALGMIADMGLLNAKKYSLDHRSWRTG
jgi:hypothetical protein